MGSASFSHSLLLRRRNNGDVTVNKLTASPGIAEFAGLKFAGLENDGLENDGLENDGVEQEETVRRTYCTR